MPVLTDAAVRKYTAKAERREIADTKAPGLYLIVQPRPKGSKSWALRFRRPDGRPAKLTLGRVDLLGEESSDGPVVGGPLTLRAARELANKIDRQRAMGVDVVEEYKAAKLRQRAESETRIANSFGAAAREFFVDHKARKRKTRPRRWRGDAALLGLRWPPGCDPATSEPEVIRGGLADTWRDKPVADISRFDVAAVVEDARKLGVPGLERRNDDPSDARARKMHSVLSVFCRWLVQRHKIADTPFTGLERPAPPPPRRRILNTKADMRRGDELRWFWTATESLGAPFGALVRLLLLTGCRLNEIAAARWEELSDDLQALRLPGERTKNGLPHEVYLPPMARDLLASVRRIESCKFIFSTTGRSPVSGFSKMKKEVDRLMLAAARKERGADASVPPWTLHDLRRSCASGMASIKIEPHVIEACLNHISGAKSGVAGVYNVEEYEPEKREAWRRWAKYVEDLVSGRSAKVVPLRKRSK